jgi:hypothetical protein
MIYHSSGEIYKPTSERQHLQIAALATNRYSGAAGWETLPEMQAWITCVGMAGLEI